jgi:hypothetical protein
MPLSTIFQLYLDSVLLMEETGVLRENHRLLKVYVNKNEPKLKKNLLGFVWYTYNCDVFSLKLNYFYCSNK